MLNPVIISSQLNFTLTHLADVMEKSLDVTTISIEPLTTLPVPSSSPQALSILSQLPGPQSTLSLIFFLILKSLIRQSGLSQLIRTSYWRLTYLLLHSSSPTLQINWFMLHKPLLLSVTGHATLLSFVST